MGLWISVNDHDYDFAESVMSEEYEMEGKLAAVAEASRSPSPIAATSVVDPLPSSSLFAARFGQVSNHCFIYT